MGQDKTGLEEYTNTLIKTPLEEVIPLIKKFAEARNKFFASIDAWKNSTGEERQHHLAAADKHSTEALKHLMNINEIAEKKKDQTLRNLAIATMRDVLNARKMIGLKTEQK